MPGARSLDVFDLHAYPDTPDDFELHVAQKQALALRIFRDYWDPTYVSEVSDIDQKWTTFIQPKKTIPFRIPRMRAIANMIYPGTPLSVTEWNAAIAGESDYLDGAVAMPTLMASWGANAHTWHRVGWRRFRGIRITLG